MDRLRALSRGDLGHEYPLASRLAAEISRPAVLYFATLLHDVGKDIGGKNHSERGARLVKDILRRLPFSEASITAVAQLVEKHLRMYHVATRRDIDDPETLSGFCAEVRNHEKLRELYLLTVCDVSTTSPTAMTAWKARMLDELYHAADRTLGEGRETLSEVLTEKRKAVQELWGQPEDEKEAQFLQHVLEAVPERYLYANDAEHILRHLRFAWAARLESATVDVLARDEEYAELCFVADDRPGLLALVTAALAAARLGVVGAQIYSWLDESGRVRALDLFWVKGSSNADAIRSAIPRIQRDLGRLLSGELDPEALVAGAGSSRVWSERHAPAVPTEVSLDDHATAHTVLEVMTEDRPGLLFWLAHTLQEAGLTIALAKINTEGNSVADVFYVVDAAGTKISDSSRVEDIKGRILRTIAKLQGTDT